jgi:hypothetical protein
VKGVKTHPALIMLYTWLFVLALFFVLPFQLIGREVSVDGAIMLAGFIAMFCLGGLICSLLQRVRQTDHGAGSRQFSVNFGPADLLCLLVSAAASGIWLYVIFDAGIVDLEGAWLVRALRADDLLAGRESQSSLSFQLAFLLYPIGYVVIVREVVFNQSIRLVRLGALGAAPLVLAAVAMGGRGPILLALVLFVLSLRARRQLLGIAPKRAEGSRRSPRFLFSAAAFVVVALVAMNYFVDVFIARAAGVGGADAMLEIAANNWGVTFAGARADWMVTILGSGNTYLVFVFSWYLVQGMVIANELFTNYVGPPHYGAYGIELVTAAMRRLNGDFIADRFYSLLDLNVFGFLPSAFGSVYVDFKYYGLIPVFLWGYFAALVYHRVRERTDPRWFLIAPFILLGILFSLLNTPIGLGNGLMSHFWMIVLFLTIRVRAAEALPAAGAHPPPLKPAAAATSQ